MSAKKPSRRDRQIKTALIYAGQNRDFRTENIKQLCRIKKGRYEDTEVTAILQAVKDIAPFELIYVWERPGWWTTAPTAEIRLVDAYRNGQQGATRWTRTAELARRHRRGEELTGRLRLAAKQAVGVKELFEDDLPASDRQDSTLFRIDRLMEAEGSNGA